jgi:hypothetical protein
MSCFFLLALASESVGSAAPHHDQFYRELENDRKILIRR